MAEEEKTNAEAVESAVADYEASEDAVKAAQDALAQAQAAREEKKAAAQQSIEELKARFESVGSAVGEKVEEVASEVSAKVEEKLDAAKDEWAQLAQTDPDAARRQLRRFWILVAGGAGLVVGAVLGAFLTWLF